MKLLSKKLITFEQVVEKQSVNVPLAVIHCCFIYLDR